jgi:hypothetical protein
MEEQLRFKGLLRNPGVRESLDDYQDYLDQLADILPPALIGRISREYRRDYLDELITLSMAYEKLSEVKK